MQFPICGGPQRPACDSRPRQSAHAPTGVLHGPQLTSDKKTTMYDSCLTANPAAAVPCPVTGHLSPLCAPTLAI